MSASLVGSEMCIRDSALTGGTLQRPGKSSPDARPHTKNLVTPDGRPHAVSYTHLTLPTICSV
eukprot:7200357-Alexandrium_andersonii.AAC.1